VYSNVDPDACGPIVVEFTHVRPVVYHSICAFTREPSGSVICARTFGCVERTKGRLAPVVHSVDGSVERLITCGIALKFTTAYGGLPPSDEENRFQPLWFDSFAAMRPMPVPPQPLFADSWKKPGISAETQPSLHDEL
jgi:hypothetical protein